MDRMEQIACSLLPLHPPRVNGSNGLVLREIPFRYLKNKKKKRERENVELVVLQLAATVGLSTHLSSEFLPSCFALPVLLQYSLLFVCTNIPSAAFHVQQNRFEIFPSRK